MLPTEPDCVESVTVSPVIVPEVPVTLTLQLVVCATVTGVEQLTVVVVPAAYTGLAAIPSAKTANNKTMQLTF